MKGSFSSIFITFTPTLM